MEPSFRVLGEGLPVVLPYIDPATILVGDIVVLKTLLGTYYPLCSAFAEPFKSAVEARGTCYSGVRGDCASSDRFCRTW